MVFLFRCLTVIFFATAAVQPAAAANSSAPGKVQFPIANHLGLVPPPGLRLIGKAPAFQDPDHHVVMLLLEMPPAAYEKLRPTMTTEAAKQHGIVLDKRELLFTDAGTMQLSAGEDTKTKTRKWFLLGLIHGFTAVVSVSIPDAARALYPNSAILASLKTLTVRTPPLSEQLQVLPFTLGDLGDFKVSAVINRRVVVLTRDGDIGPEHQHRPQLVIGVGKIPPGATDDHRRLAERAFQALPGFRNVHVTNEARIRVGGAPAFEIRAEAKEAATGLPVVLVQWLRFGGGGFLEILGVTPKQDWDRDFPQFRAIRDAVQPR